MADKIVLDGKKISLKEFDEVKKVYDKSKGQKKLKKLKEGVYKTLFKLDE